MRSSLKLLCRNCKFVRRNRVLYVVCSGSAKHKQRQGYHTLASSSSVPTAAAEAGQTTTVTMETRKALSTVLTTFRQFTGLL